MTTSQQLHQTGLAEYPYFWFFGVLIPYLADKFENTRNTGTEYAQQISMTDADSLMWREGYTAAFEAYTVHVRHTSQSRATMASKSHPVGPVWNQFRVNGRTGTVWSVECRHCDHAFTCTSSTRMKKSTCSKSAPAQSRSASGAGGAYGSGSSYFQSMCHS
jgi:hypothetical protein